jgi:hypothetical protein
LEVEPHAIPEMMIFCTFPTVPMMVRHRSP